MLAGVSGFTPLSSTRYQFALDHDELEWCANPHCDATTTFEACLDGCWQCPLFNEAPRVLDHNLGCGAEGDMRDRCLLGATWSNLLLLILGDMECLWDLVLMDVLWEY